ncbi:unnamed protein product [Arctia plantaginis]|uniref:Uncharacterized protein n=1 Tax=Arctia plantaginis TaxID=874455 RepID=A0A8S0YY17_ARCPL|nr:unnamed protein product [Arctia plantaginis]CAB3242272.1 unnamed protein product [Arctia plantaginis]
MCRSKRFEFCMYLDVSLTGKGVMYNNNPRLLNLPVLEFARGARSQDKSVRVGAVPTAGHALAACDTRPAAHLTPHPALVLLQASAELSQHKPWGKQQHPRLLTCPY